MALLSRRTRKTSRRAFRKAESKALLHKAGLEAKLSAKNERKFLKTLAKNDQKALESQQQVEKAQIRAYEAQIKRANEGKVSAASVRKYIGIARIVTPILLPIAYRAATVIRSQLDQRRAGSIGVSVADLTQYAGHGARLSARIAGAEKSLAELRTTKSGTADTAAFSDAITTRLKELTTAVSAAEQMPASRRKAAHGAISDELDGIEADILARLGVR